MEDIFKKDLSGELVSPDEPGYDKLINAIWDTMKLAAELNVGWHTPEEVRSYLSRITGREVDESVTLLPPFYVDYGKNIRMGKRCWIQQGCTFFDCDGMDFSQVEGMVRRAVDIYNNVRPHQALGMATPARAAGM